MKTLSEFQLDEGRFVRVLAVIIAGCAGAMTVFAVGTLPRGLAVLAFGVVAFVTSGYAFDAWRAREPRKLLAPLVLLAALTVGFVVALPHRSGFVPMRLLQVATIALSVGLVVAGMFFIRAKCRPMVALAIAVAVAAELLVVEIVVGRSFGASATAIPPRAEWSGLKAVQRNQRGATADSSTSIWSATAQTDSQLGLVFAPGTRLTTLYPDNPRGYFARGDFRRDIWTLDVAPGSAAELVTPGDSGQVRVAISAAQRDVPSWHIALNELPIALEAGRTYQLDFRARADRARSVTVAVTQARDSFALLGLLDSIQVATDWKPYRFYFTPRRPERNARIHFALGGNDASTEFDHVELRDVSVDRPVVPDAARHPWLVSYRFNSLGCRGSDPQAAPPGTHRVLVLGDGFTTGVGVHEQDTFAAGIEKLVNTGASPLRPAQVLNCGVPGYGTHEQRLLYGRLAHVRPEFVLLMIGPDSDRFHWEQFERESRGARHTRMEQLFRTWARIKALRQTRRTYAYDKSVDDILRLNEAVRTNGGTLVIVVAQTDGSSQWKDVRAGLNPLRATGVRIIDAGDALSSGRGWDATVVHSTDSHPDERVHAALARVLVQALSTTDSGAPAQPPARQ